jgi:hypothetical protein
MAIDKKLIDQLLKNHQPPGDHRGERLLNS